MTPGSTTSGTQQRVLKTNYDRYLFKAKRVITNVRKPDLKVDGPNFDIMKKSSNPRDYISINDYLTSRSGIVEDKKNFDTAGSIKFQDDPPALEYLAEGIVEPKSMVGKDMWHKIKEMDKILPSRN